MGRLAGWSADAHRGLAGAVVRARTAFVWLIRHPTASVVVGLALFAALGLMTWLGADDTPSGGPHSGVPASTARSTLPEPTQFPPRRRVEVAHRALHAMGRACEEPVASRDPKSVRRPVAVIEQFARDYPNGGFTIDDEAGTTISFLVVLRYELRSCDPSLVPGVDKFLPPQFRDER